MAYRGARWLLTAVLACGCPTASTNADSSATTEGDASPICEGGGDQWSDDSGSLDGSEDGGPLGMDDDMPLVANIPDLQQGLVGSERWVRIEGAVMITPPVPTETGAGSELFIQAPAGGPWSGIRVRYDNRRTPPAVGEVVDVVGFVREHNGYYLVDLMAVGSITPLGPTALPPATVVTVDDLAVGDARGRPYEAIQVRVESVVVTDDDPCDGEFVIEDVARVDDRFAPDQLPSPRTGTTLTSVQG
ncbi:MAG: hypothetical protein K0V04_20765, partial [Deltaproteobacteria bacterium]|nr:hypothetical protein [Deltaproteobacteria bacterium]